MKAVYIAHPLSAPTREGIEANRQNAARWVGWLAREFHIAPVADWIVLTGQWEETAENRALGLSIDCELVARCDEMWMVGGRVSDGMLIEAKHAKVVRDLTRFGYEAPVVSDTYVRAAVAEIVWTNP
jgi:hypothetical protein